MRIECDWTLRDGDKSLISNILFTKLSNVLWLHFLRTENNLSKSFGAIQSLPSYGDFLNSFAMKERAGPYGSYDN